MSGVTGDFLSSFTYYPIPSKPAARCPASSMTGEEIAAYAYSLPPLTPKGLGPGVIFVALLMGVTSLLVVSLRAWVRAGYSGASTRTWGPDDYLAVGGTVS